MKLKFLTPGVFFDNGSVSTGTGFYLDSYAPQKLVIDASAGSQTPPLTLLPNGTSSNYLDFCFGNTGSLVASQILSIKYFDEKCNELIDCAQLDTLYCELDCTDIPCVNIYDIVVECDSFNSNKFIVNFTVQNNTFDQVIDKIDFTVINPVLSSFVPSTMALTPLNPGGIATGQQVCVLDLDPAPRPKILDFWMSAQGYSQTDSTDFCCHDIKDTISIVLPNCCDPCDTTWVNVDNVSVPNANECCYNIDINAICDSSLSKVVVESITPGFTLGFLSNGGLANWNFAQPNSTTAIWTPSGGTYANPANYIDLINFCIDSIGTGTSPQIKVQYVTTNINGIDTVLCDEIIDLECDKDIKCLDIVEHTVYCDTLGNYFIDVCFDNNSTPAFTADGIRIDIASAVPPTNIVTPSDLNSITAPPHFPFAPLDPVFCVTLDVLGSPTPSVGDILDLEFKMYAGAAGIPDTCCYESESLNIVLPICCDETVKPNLLMSNYRTAVTCGVSNDFLPASSRYTFGMIDHSSVLPTTGRNDFTGLVSDFHHPSWHINSIGNVFGIAIDYEGNAYAAASANYGSGYLGSNALIQYGNIGGGANDLGAAGTIYKMDNITGQASVFCQLPQNAFNFAHQTCEGPSPDINRTTGPALGNIVYDEINNQMFAANWEDGRIYRIDMNGSILDSYDPGILDNNNVGMPGIDNDLIPYGLDIDDDASRLFFGTLYNGTTLYSIDLNNNGSFAGTINNSSGNSSLTIDNYVNNEVLHFSFASLIPASDFQSISDLEFLPNGNFMVGLRRGCNNNFATSYNHHATSYMLSESSGIYNTLISQIPISYDSNLPFAGAFDGDDQYGGVAYMEFNSYPFELVVSSSDILNEPGPHGIAVFEQSFTGAPITNLAAIAYAPITVDTDMKGIGGDVQVFNPCYTFEKLLVNEFCPPTDVISLNAGWNLLSLDVTPEQPSVDSVFNALTPGNLEIAVGFDNGAIVYNPLLPPFLNSLKTLQDGYGYWVKLSYPDVLEVTGTCIPDAFKRDFDAGWNLTAYPPATPATPGNYFVNEIANDNLINVSGYYFGTLVYDPAVPPFLNSLDSLKNGYGYWIKLNNAVTNKNGQIFKTNVFSFITGTTNLTEGSIINIETAVEQVGEIKVLQDGYLAITPIYGDDLITLNKQEGLTIGETLYFNYNGQVSEVNSVFKGDMSLEKVDLDFDQTTSFTIHPNPNNGSFKIDLGQPLGNDGFVEVIDATGKVQYRSQIKNASAYLNLGNVKPGIYMIKVADEKSAEIQKVIIH